MFLLLSISVNSQNYSGIYRDKNDITLKISNYNKAKGSLTFELIVNEHPCFGNRKELAFNHMDECDGCDPNEFVYQSGQDVGDETLYLNFQTNGSVILRSDENAFNIQGMCSIWKDEVIFKKITTPNKTIKKTGNISKPKTFKSR